MREAIAEWRRYNPDRNFLEVSCTVLVARAITEGDIANRQGGISALAQGKLLGYAAEALEDNEFGLHLAELAKSTRSRIAVLCRARRRTCRRRAAAHRSLLPHWQ